MKRTISPFGNDKITLRLIEARDLATTRAWRNRDDARQWFKTTALISEKQHQAWFQQYTNKDTDFLFIIESNHITVGQISVYNVDWAKKTAEIGRFLAAPESVGRGYISMACAELIAFCEKELSLKYLYLEVMENNERAKRLYVKQGFAEEGCYDGMIRMGRKLSHTA